MGERKRHSVAFKAKVAVEAIKGQRSLNELAGLYQVHPTQIAVWEKRALAGLPELFADGRRKGPEDDESLQARLYQEIGQLKVEPDFLKKSWGCSADGEADDGRGGASGQAGRGMAIAGLILGYIGIAGKIIWLLAVGLAIIFGQAEVSSGT